MGKIHRESMMTRRCNCKALLQMVDGGASGSEGSDISGIDEYIPDHFDGETDGFRQVHAGVAIRRPWPGTVPGCQTCLASRTSRTKHDLKALTPTG